MSSADSLLRDLSGKILGQNIENISVNSPAQDSGLSSGLRTQLRTQDSAQDSGLSSGLRTQIRTQDSAQDSPLDLDLVSMGTLGTAFEDSQMMDDDVSAARRATTTQPLKFPQPRVRPNNRTTKQPLRDRHHRLPQVVR